MKRCILILIALASAAAWSSSVMAQASYPIIVCEACRNPARFPTDYRNFAYNQVFGPDAWLNYDQADFFGIVNLSGQSVFVDVNMDIEFFTFDFGIPIPLPYPVDVNIQIIVIQENGDQNSYMIDPRAHPDGLPVGSRRDGGGASGGGGSGPLGSQ